MSTLTSAANQSFFPMDSGMQHRVCLGGKKNTIIPMSQAKLALELSPKRNEAANFSKTVAINGPFH
jgi:hypothetical protein